MEDICSQLESIMTTDVSGSVAQVVGMTVAASDFPAPLGAVVEIQRQSGRPVSAEVVGLRDTATILYPFESLAGVRRGNRVRLLHTYRSIDVGPELLGRVVDAHGRCIDNRPQPVAPHRVRFESPPLSAIERPRIAQPLPTGVRAIDGLLPCGRGQRLGIFSGSGVGKSVLLGMMARHTAADVNVVALVGERGREVNEFIERDLGPEGLRHSVVVVATSDESPLVRVQAAKTATAIAEYFRDAGNDVLLLMDSLTRVAMAQREIGLAAGEPPATRGYPPSIYTLLPKLVERAGRAARGAITAFYSVLVEGDDENEPVADAVRGLLDGHTWLSRKIAARGQYPAIDVLGSISRLAPQIAPPEQLAAAQIVRELLAAYEEHEDVITIGAYRRGTNRTVDAAIEMRGPIADFLRQGIEEGVAWDAAQAQLLQLAARCQAQLQSAATPATAPAAMPVQPAGNSSFTAGGGQPRRAAVIKAAK